MSLKRRQIFELFLNLKLLNTLFYSKNCNKICSFVLCIYIFKRRKIPKYALMSDKAFYVAIGQWH